MSLYGFPLSVPVSPASKILYCSVMGIPFCDDFQRYSSSEEPHLHYSKSKNALQHISCGNVLDIGIHLCTNILLS